MNAEITYRRDIDGLRGIAILAVLGFHFVPGVFRGGFVGVDVFFVISGYLITGILLADRLTLGEFYGRRIKRLFPALAITLGFALLLGTLFLLPDEFRVLCKNILAAATFTTNFVLMNDIDVGYFADLSINNQLIHLWSLSIEEQFYLFWPLVLVVIPHGKRAVVVTGLLALFMLFDFANVFEGTLDRYYFPGTRFWEIFAGAWLAVMRPRIKTWRDSRLLNDGAMVAGICMILAAIILARPSEQWPGLKALVPVLGAILVLNFQARGRWADILISNRALVGLGLISYPLYLYHWLFLSFASQLYSGRLPVEAKLGTLVVSFLLSVVTYFLVETPIRRGKYNLRRFALLPATIFAIFVVSGCIYLADGLGWRYPAAQVFNDVPKADEFVRIENVCLQKHRGAFVEGILPKREFCSGGEAEKPVIVIGDSHASKLYQGFVGLGVSNIVHLGRGSCAPVLNLDPGDPWYKCQPTVNGILDYAIKSDASLIVLTGVFERYFDGTYQMQKSQQEVEGDVRQWFEILAGSGKSILVVLDNPTLPFEPKECMQRPFDFNQRADCSFNRSVHEQKVRTYGSIFRRNAQRFANVTLLDSSKFFCDKSQCTAVNADGLLYTGDNNHLSLRGAMIVGREILRLFPASFLLYAD